MGTFFPVRQRGTRLPQTIIIININIRAAARETQKKFDKLSSQLDGPITL